MRKNSLAIQVYLLEQYDVGLWDRDSVYYVHEYEQPYSGDRVYLEFRNFDVETITIRALDTAEIPARIRDRQALIQATGAAVLAVPRKPYTLVTGTGDWTPGR